MADQQRTTGATVHTPYYLASVSKTVTATALMELVEQKKVDLDQPVNRYLRTSKNDHLAGTLGVLLHDRFRALGWISAGPKDNHTAYDVSQHGAKGFEALGIDICAVRTLRRRFAFGCLDWSERPCGFSESRTAKEMGDPGSRQ